MGDTFSTILTKKTYKLIYKKMIKKIISAYIIFWKKALDFNGLTSRFDWRMVQIAHILISLITLPVFFRTFGFNIYGIICIIPQISMDIRRLRDIGKNWKWIFINLIPIFGWIWWFIIIGFSVSKSNIFFNNN